MSSRAGEGEVIRVSKTQQEKNRARVTAAAAKLLRERGIDGIGVDALAKAAGMTHGAVYSHFKDKDDLAAAALAQALAELAAQWHADAAKQGPVGSLVGRMMRGTTKRYLDLEARGLKARSEQLSGKTS